MDASMNDMLTAIKNIVTAINDQSRQTLLISGSQVAEGLASTAGGMVLTGSGRLVNISVVTAGSGAGEVHDTNVATNMTGANFLCVIPAAVGIYAINMPFNLGIAVKTGTGQVIAISYSIGNVARGGQ